MSVVRDAPEQRVEHNEETVERNNIGEQLDHSATPDESQVSANALCGRLRPPWKVRHHHLLSEVREDVAMAHEPVHRRGWRRQKISWQSALHECAEQKERCALRFEEVGDGVVRTQRCFAGLCMRCRHREQRADDNVHSLRVANTSPSLLVAMEDPTYAAVERSGGRGCREKRRNKVAHRCEPQRGRGESVEILLNDRAFSRQMTMRINDIDASIVTRCDIVAASRPVPQNCYELVVLEIWWRPLLRLSHACGAERAPLAHALLHRTCQW